MAESSLSLTYAQMRVTVADYLKLTRDDDNWDTDDLARVNEIINRGYRQFLYPPKLDPRRRAHDWSFLRPTATISAVADDYVYSLPDDFERILGGVTYPADAGYSTITQVSEEAIRRWRQHDTTTAPPRHYAVRPIANDGDSGQRHEILLWPTPSSAWTLTYRYISRPSAMANGVQYPVGGTEHGETILASILAVAEMDRHEERGPRWTYFLDRLAASIDRDRAMQPDSLGWNGDTWGQVVRQGVTVSYNGSVIN